MIEAGEALRCVVDDLSDGGARLSVTGATDVPERFGLHFDGTTRTLPAQVRWRRGDQLGVEFDRPAMVGPDRR